MARYLLHITAHLLALLTVSLRHSTLTLPPFTDKTKNGKMVKYILLPVSCVSTHLRYLCLVASFLNSAVKICYYLFISEFYYTQNEKQRFSCFWIPELNCFWMLLVCQRTVLFLRGSSAISKSITDSLVTLLTYPDEHTPNFPPAPCSNSHSSAPALLYVWLPKICYIWWMELCVAHQTAHHIYIVALRSRFYL